MKFSLRSWTTCLLCFAPLARGAAPARPNILFVVADQWRAQAFGFAGDKNVKTQLEEVIPARTLTLARTNHWLVIRGPHLPGDIRINYPARQ